MNIAIPQHDIPVRNTCDVLVIGAGPAGVGAAITAARAGAKVTLVEYGGKLGGMWTLGLLSPYFDNRNKQGLNAEIRERLTEQGHWGGLWNISFDPNAMALLLDELALDANLDVLLYTIAAQPIMDGDTIRGVIVHNKSGEQAILASVVIDCTGDGDIAARAGAPFTIGRPSDGCFQPMTMMFRIGGLKDDYPRDNVLEFYREICRHLPESEVLAKVPFNFPALIRLPAPGEALVQWTHIRHHLGSDGDELTKATFEGRRQVQSALELLRLAKPVIGDVRLLELPSVIGVRETRRVTGEYVISDEDVRHGSSHPDGICRVTFGVDIHEPDAQRQTNLANAGFDIPVRSLVPLRVENLMTAGRCISGSYLAHAAYRVTGDCLAMGEGAARHAVAALQAGKTVRQLALANGQPR